MMTRIIFSILLYALFPFYVYGQTVTLLDPAGDGGFESGSTFAANNWTATVTGTNRQWYVGTGMSGYTGARAAFIGNSSTSIGTNTQSRIVHLYRNLSIPVGATNITLSFKYKQTTVDNTYDYLQVFLNGNTPSYGTAETAGLLTTVDPNSTSPYSSFTTVNVTIPDSYAGSTNNLIFTFNADNQSPHAYGGVDDVSVTYTPPIPSSISISQTISPVGATSVCNQDYNKLTASGGTITNYIAYSENFSSRSNWAYYSSVAGNNNIIGFYFNSNNAGGISYEGGLGYNTGSNSSASWMFTPYNTSTNQYISVDASSLTSVNLSFKHMLDIYSGSYNRNIYVDVSSNNFATYSTVWSLTNITSNIAAIPVSINLNAFAGTSTLYFRFRYTGDSYGLDYWYIDDIILSGTKQYPITWSPTTNLFTDSALSTPYTGSNLSTVYASPNGGETTYTATTGGTYPKTANATVFTNSKVFTGSVNNNWANASNWSPTGIPDLTKCVRIPSSKTVNINTVSGVNTNASAEYVRVIAGGALNINTNNSLTIDNALNNENSSTSPNVVVESDGNLKQNNSTTNTGNIIVKRKAKLKRLEYNYWSSPVQTQKLKDFSPNTLSSRFYYYNESTDYFANEDWNNNFTVAKGYAIRAPNDYTIYHTDDWAFTGTPNNGTKTIAITKNGNGYNLIGNPYPSNISFSAFHSANSTIINPIAYFWTNANINPPMQGSSYSSNNYATRNLTGGSPASGSSTTPTDEIVVGQGFIVQKINSGSSSLTFNNNMRRTTTGNFFNLRTASSKEESPKYWLKLTTPVQNFNTLLVGYVNGATNGIDLGYDAEPISEASDLFYSIENNKNLIIQGRDGNFSVNDIVPLGANFFEPGNYEISIAQVEGIFNGSQAIYLRDKNLNTTVNLSERAYQFFANAGVTKDRFEVIYKPDSTLGTDNISKNQETIIYENNGSIFIENKANKIAEIQIFDAGGRLLNISKPNDHKFGIEKSKFDKGLLIFKINLKNKTITKKFLLK